MLLKRSFYNAPILLTLFGLIYNVSAKRNDLLDRIVSSDRNPVVVYFKGGLPSQNTKHLHDHDENGKVKISTYWLDYLIRATEDVSEEEELIDALRSKNGCGPVSSCVKKCPPREKKCNTACKQVFDKRDECGVPTSDPCTKQDKCGKTLPPYW